MARRGAALLLVIALAALGAGCSGESSKRIDVPTTRSPEGTGMGALFVGTFEGDAESGCVWLLPEQQDRKSYDPVRVAVVWPAGFSARTNPLRLYDAEGQLVATEGDPLRLGGGFVPATGFEGLGRCQLGESVWGPVKVSAWGKNPLCTLAFRPTLRRTAAIVTHHPKDAPAESVATHITYRVVR